MNTNVYSIFSRHKYLWLTIYRKGKAVRNYRVRNKGHTCILRLRDSIGLPYAKKFKTQYGKHCLAQAEEALVMYGHAGYDETTDSVRLRENKAEKGSK